MSSYDIFMIVVLLGCTAFGAWKGMAWQIASVSSLVISYIVALRFSADLAPLIGAQAPWNRLVAMLILYLVTSLAIWMAFRMVARAIDRVKLREFDRQLGALFGAFKGVLLCVAITFFVVTLTATGRELVLNSKSGFYISRLLDHAHPLIPEEVHNVLHEHFEEFQEKLEPGQRGPDHKDPHQSGTVADQRTDPVDKEFNGEPRRDEASTLERLEPAGKVLDRVDDWWNGDERGGRPPAGRPSPEISSDDNGGKLDWVIKGMSWLEKLGRSGGENAAPGEVRRPPLRHEESTPRPMTVSEWMKQPRVGP